MEYWIVSFILDLSSLFHFSLSFSVQTLYLLIYFSPVNIALDLPSARTQFGCEAGLLTFEVFLTSTVATPIIRGAPCWADVLILIDWLTSPLQGPEWYSTWLSVRSDEPVFTHLTLLPIADIGGTLHINIHMDEILMVCILWIMYTLLCTCIFVQSKTLFRLMFLWIFGTSLLLSVTKNFSRQSSNFLKIYIFFYSG